MQPSSYSQSFTSSTNSKKFWCHVCHVEFKIRQIHGENVDEFCCPKCGDTIIEEIVASALHPKEETTHSMVDSSARENTTYSHSYTDNYYTPDGTTSTTHKSSTSQNTRPQRDQQQEFCSPFPGFGFMNIGSGHQSQFPAFDIDSDDDEQANNFFANPFTGFQNGFDPFQHLNTMFDQWNRMTGQTIAGSHSSFGGFDDIFSDFRNLRAFHRRTTQEQSSGFSFEDFINHIMQNDPDRYGTPPASKESVARLISRKVNDREVQEKEECSVCQSAYESRDDILEMPCKHIFHKECLKPWLNIHNSCPICRYELKTDDREYENQKQ
mmetsp:Transcript_17290/g.19483  ORF Transcript_17290/g.19483 Transcript_17290/m.19483 type:complete len:324 (-) Transcript_17290:210-1181(-)